jgi:O-antigen/teichoic acid export membrane protein
MKLPIVKGFDEQALNKYLKNTSWLMFGKVLGLVASLIVTRYLGPELFGDLSFVLALVTITGAVGALGLDTFIIREIINEPNKRDEILGTALGLRLITNTALIPITIGVYLIFHYLSTIP